MLSRWRKAAVDGWYGSQDHVGQADTNPEPHIEAAADAAVRVVLEHLRDIAAMDGNLDDSMWVDRFTALLEGRDLKDDDDD